MSSILATVVDEWYDGKRHHVIGTLAFSGSYATGGLTLDFGIAGIATQQIPTWMDAPWYEGYLFKYVPGTYVADGNLRVFAGSGEAQATGTLTSNNTNVTSGDTVTIGNQTYTFATTLVPGNPGQVHKSTTADLSLLNLIRAINGSGTPGTDYDALTPVNTQVTAATSVTSHAFAVTAIAGGTQGNAIATTTVNAGTLSWGATTLTGGADPAVGSAELGAGAFPADLVTYAVPFYAIFPQLI